MVNFSAWAVWPTEVNVWAGILNMGLFALQALPATEIMLLCPSTYGLYPGNSGLKSVMKCGKIYFGGVWTMSFFYKN